MYSDKRFHFALIVSILVHSVVFVEFPWIAFLPKIKDIEKLNITYYKTSNKAQFTELPEIKKEEILEPLKVQTTQKNKEEPVLDKIEEKIIPKESFLNIEEKKIENVIQEEKDALKKSSYIAYYRAVREKIKKCADINYSQNNAIGVGEVFLFFLVADNGELLKVAVLNNNSTDALLLRTVAINSIRDAAPFPRFPDGITQSQITFNVAISYESK